MGFVGVHVSDCSHGALAYGIRAEVGAAELPLAATSFFMANKSFDSEASNHSTGLNSRELSFSRNALRRAPRVGVNHCSCAAPPSTSSFSSVAFCRIIIAVSLRSDLMVALA